MGLRLELSQISKSYAGQHVLKECSCTFDRGATYVIMGPNGCGKSTLLRISALLEKPDQGEVTSRPTSARCSPPPGGPRSPAST